MHPLLWLVAAVFVLLLCPRTNLKSFSISNHPYGLQVCGVSWVLVPYLG